MESDGQDQHSFITNEETEAGKHNVFKAALRGYPLLASQAFPVALNHTVAELGMAEPGMPPIGFQTFLSFVLLIVSSKV